MIIRHLLFTALLLSTALATAQPPRDGKGPRDGHGPRDRERHQPVIERWLHHLESKDPAEHRRLTALREENPAAFRSEIRRQLAEVRENAPRHREGRAGPPDLSRERQAVRDARTDAERARALATLREALAQHIDMRLAQREQRIRSIREELERLETRHRADQARRDTWIEETLERLLEE